MIAQSVRPVRARTASRPWRLAAVALLGLVVAACQPTVNRQGQIGGETRTQPSEPAQPAGPPQRVGLLVPMTGNAAAVGVDLARAAELALIERGNDRLELLPRDTQSTQEGAVVAARQLLEQEDVDVILGPLFGSSAERVAELARARGITVLSFSSQGSIAGDGLFVLGYRPEEQVERVTLFALGRGYARAAALVPDDVYGRTAVDALRATLRERLGSELVAVEFYARDGSDAPARIESLRQRGSRGSDLPAFDTLLLADGGARLRAVAPQLTDAGIDPVDVRMLGTMLWPDDPATLAEPALAGGWYAGVADAATREFRNRFRNVFGTDPHPLAVLGYDGLLIAADAATDRLTARSRIVDGRGYQGEGGIIRLLPTGVAEHGLAVFELTPNGPVVIDPAPVRFDQPAS
ncbi:MAG: penicillin-binding protein activator [Pseudomonadota bacterium]